MQKQIKEWKSFKHIKQLRVLVTGFVWLMINNVYFSCWNSFLKKWFFLDLYYRTSMLYFILYYIRRDMRSDTNHFMLNIWPNYKCSFAWIWIFYCNVSVDQRKFVWKYDSIWENIQTIQISRIQISACNCWRTFITQDCYWSTNKIGWKHDKFENNASAVELDF